MIVLSPLWGVIASIFVLPTLGKVYENPSQLVRRTYDYIVIGAGAAGAVVAARLSENPRVSVLLVEAGVSDEDFTDIPIPLMGLFLAPSTPLDWNYTTIPLPGLNGRAIPYPRGKVLGGSTSVNYMVYMRGSKEDFDRYASVTGEPGWDWDHMQEYAFKNEDLVPPADHHDTKGEFVPSLHGTSGAISVSLGGNPTPLDSRVIATTQEMPDEFPFNPDMIGGDVLGIGWAFASIGDGTRSSSSTGYLTPASGRSNLDIVLRAQATKLVMTGRDGDVPCFRSVLVATKSGGTVYTLTARNEIILSAGTIGTPALLQLSGIGNKTELAAAGVATIVDNPSVGKNLSDHVLLPNVWNANSTDTYDPVFRNPGPFLEQWEKNKTGPLASHIANHLGWLRFPETSDIFKLHPDPSAGPKSSHFEMIFLNYWLNPSLSLPDAGSYMTQSTVLISPTARGFVQITSPDPFTHPLVNPNWLGTPFDIAALIETVKISKRFFSGKAWEGYVLDGLYGLEDAETDEEIEAYVRGNVNGIWHAVGTAMMSSRDAGYGVVDPDLKVKGVRGLRIVDGSVLPFVPNAHTQGTVYLIAERGADLIKVDFEDYKYKL